MKELGVIPLGFAAPDLPDFDTGAGGDVEAFNCLPRVRSYGPLPGFSPISSDTLPSPVLAGASVVDDVLSTSAVFAGTSSDLYKFVSGMWTGFGTGYSASDWRFVSFGRDVIAVNISNRPQTKTISGADPFVNLTATNVQGKYAAVVRNQLVLAHVIDDDGLNSRRVRWSGFGDPTSWAIDPVTMADFQDLRGDYGPIRGIVGGSVGLVFRERGIHVMNFVGSPLVYRFDVIEEEVGALVPGSIIPFGNNTYFLSQDGFRVISRNGGMSQPIGEERIDRFILGDIDLAYPDNMSACLMEKEQVIIWLYPGLGNVGGRPNKLVCFNVATNRWTTGEELSDVVFPIFGLSTNSDSIDGLDTLGTGVDNPVYGLVDSSDYIGNIRICGLINHNGTLGSMSGSPKTARFTTREFQHVSGRNTCINYVRPLVDGASSIKMKILSRREQGKNKVVSPAGTGVPVNDQGVCPFRVDSRYISYQMEIEDGFKDAIGVEPYGQPSGYR